MLFTKFHNLWKYVFDNSLQLNIFLSHKCRNSERKVVILSILSFWTLAVGMKLDGVIVIFKTVSYCVSEGCLNSILSGHESTVILTQRSFPAWMQFVLVKWRDFRHTSFITNVTTSTTLFRQEDYAHWDFIGHFWFMSTPETSETDNRQWFPQCSHISLTICSSLPGHPCMKPAARQRQNDERSNSTKTGAVHVCLSFLSWLMIHLLL